MIKYEKYCVSCPDCVGTGCKYYGEKYKVLYCDRCGMECEQLYVWDGEQVCHDCLMDDIEVITADDDDKMY